MSAAAALVPVETVRLMLVHGAERAEAFARNSKADNTRRGYASDWRSFETWCQCQTRGLSSLPATPQSIAVSRTWP